MTELLKPKKTDTVLEIGAGSGYQAAILSTLTKHVYSIEIIPELATLARQRLNTLGFKNISVILADGYYDLKKHAPFNKIIVTAAANHVPPSPIQLNIAYAFDLICSVPH
jgi:protein-L-isoaspartate(D-aspartate) O-methyltransferase